MGTESIIQRMSASAADLREAFQHMSASAADTNEQARELLGVVEEFLAEEEAARDANIASRIGSFEYICTVCEETWDHYPQGDEEYGCTQEVEVDGEILHPHNYVTPAEHKQLQE